MGWAKKVSHKVTRLSGSGCDELVRDVFHTGKATGFSGLQSLHRPKDSPEDWPFEPNRLTSHPH